ncbi:ribonuclease H-like YkuK family protein [Paenibacillus pasadenensis]|uniref:ribonuclease H-like YkuK family protein n=1 Tax=Paenibacillus pasadenensis TaxID=217090 RepID=UPI00203EE05F|nr:ribonuclease H-like YkuK family protein [Paenibacillus pasadenensis]
MTKYKRKPEAHDRANRLKFHNVKEQHMSVDEVAERLLRFVAEDPRASYHFAIGTDCQVHPNHTKFITGLVLHRIGRGAWACYRPYVLGRELDSIHEKLAFETTLSQEMAAYLEELSVVRRMEELLLPHVYQGAELCTFIDIDAGTEPCVSPTALYVQEMVARIQTIGSYVARVKPEAYVASSYANRFTKRPARLVM